MEKKLENLEFLAKLINFADRIKHAKNKEELSFIACNTSKIITSFHQSFLWNNNKLLNPKIVAASGISHLAQDSPLVYFLQNLIKEKLKQQKNHEFTLLNKNNFSTNIKNQWNEWLPNNVLWCPFSDHENNITGGMFFTKNDTWHSVESHKLIILSYFISEKLKSISLLKHKTYIFKYLSKSKIAISFFIILLLSFIIPVNQTVLAPAEIVAEDPYIITSPINEVIEKFYIKPNTNIKKGDNLFKLDQTELNNNLLVSTRNYQIVLENLRKASQYSFNSNEGREKLSTLKIEAKKEKLNVEYNKFLLKNSIVKSPIDGIAIYSDENDWIGKPVKIGEKILEIANENKKKLKILLPVSDAITLTPGSKIKLYLNTDPLNVIPATLTYASYSADMQPDQIYAYTLKGKFNNSNKAPRIGLRGTAKVYGNKTSLFFYIMRKPITSFRQIFGI